MKNKVIDILKRKIVEQIDYGDYPERMHPRTERNIGDPEKNLFGTNPAMPHGSQDVERLASIRFKEVVDKLRNAINQPNLTPAFVKELIGREFMMSIRGASEIERRFKDRLEDLAVRAALKVTETERGVYDIDAILLRTDPLQGTSNEKFQYRPKPKPEPEQPEEPEYGEFFDVNQLTKDEKFELEVHKRNIINGIIQGAAKKGHYIFQVPEIKEELDQMDGRLYSYYLKLMAINDYFYFIEEDMMDMMSNTGRGIGGREDIASHKVNKTKDDENEDGGEDGGEDGSSNEAGKFKITAQGVLFPILCHEVIKGIEETLGKFGYAKDPTVAADVIGQTDTLPNETMSLRIGPVLVNRIREMVPTEMFDDENYGIKPFFYKILYEIPANKFLKIIRNCVSQEERDNNDAKSKFKQIFEQAKAMKRRYEEKLAQKRNAPPPEDLGRREEPISAEEPEVEEMTDKKLAEMGLNALNFELNKAIDAENWELAGKIQKMIERKQTR